MSLTLTMITDIYASMEQGNIGKLLTILDNSVSVYTARCLGGNTTGRELILQQIPAFYSPFTEIKKIVEKRIEQDNLVIILGHIRITGATSIIEPMPFADVWRFENNRISAVNFYYGDPNELCDYLSRHVKICPQDR